MQALRKEDLFKPPGVAETLDWAAALAELDVVALDPATVSDTLGVLLKYQDDIARIEGTKAKELIDEVRAELRGGGVTGFDMRDAGHDRGESGRLAENISTSPARCARPGFRSGRARCSMRLRRCRRPASAPARTSTGRCMRCS